MATLYLVEQGSKLRKTGQRFIVTVNDLQVLEVEREKIDHVMIFGNVQVTTQALFSLLQENIELAFFSLSGKLLGQLTPPLSKNILLRIAQYGKENNQEWILRQSRLIVNAKIENMINMIKRCIKDGTDKESDIKDSLPVLENLANKALVSESVESLLGIEGSSAAIFWTCYAYLVPNLGFTGRKKHPALDPVNATLSLGYSCLSNEITSLLDGFGFDPFLGFFHKERYGHAALASDLIEVFRAPVIDRLVIKLFNLKSIKPDSFEEDREEEENSLNETKGLRLTKDGLKSFLGAYEKQLLNMSIRQILKDQVENLAAVYMDRESEIKPWKWIYT